MDNLINLDQHIFSWFNSSVGLNQIFDWLIKIIAVYAVYAVPVVMLFFWFKPSLSLLNSHQTKHIHLRGASGQTRIFLINLFVGVIISWQIIAKYLGEWINRPRPETFAGAKEVFFHPPTYAFPSDHALFFAFITTYLYLWGLSAEASAKAGYIKMANIALVATILISLARITGGLHWPGDVLAGWILGTLLAYVFYLIRKPMEKYISKPIVGVLKRIKLA